MSANYQVSPEIEPEKPDTFRLNYRELSEREHGQIKGVKEGAEKLNQILDSLIADGERSDKARRVNLAKTNLEQAVMWAVKGVTG